jgi:hypothetical protein
MKPFFVIVIATLLTGCVKQDRGADLALPTMSSTAPIIRLTSPRDYQRFDAGQIATITATITDNKQLQKVRLIVTRANGTQVLRLEKYLDVKSYDLSESFTVTAGPRYIIRIEAIDQNNNNVQTRIDVSCN